MSLSRINRLLGLLAVLILMKVGCDGVLGSDKKVDKCGLCGGNNSSCHIISGIFVRNNLHQGHNRVALIPRGACNVNITEKEASANFLALKIKNGEYFINGNHRLSHSKGYAAAGTTFEYYRPRQADYWKHREHIYAKGPLTESVVAMVLRRTDNKGIVYEYTIPTDETHTETSGGKSTAVKSTGGTSTQTRTALTKPQSDQTATNLQQQQQYYQYTRHRYQGRPTYTSGQSGGDRPVYTQTNAARTRKIRHQRKHLIPNPSTGIQQPTQTGVQPDRRNYYYGTVGSGSGSQYYAARGAQRGVYYPQRRAETQAAFGGNQQPYYQQYPVNAGAHTPVQSGQHQALTAQARYQQLLLQQQQQLAQAQTAQGYQPVVARQQPYFIPRDYLQQPVVQPQTLGVQAAGRYNPQTRYPAGQPYYQALQGRQIIPATNTLAAHGRLVNDQIAVLPSQGQLPRPLVDTETSDSSREFTWRIRGYSECSQTCGGGQQDTIVVCAKTDTQAIVTDDNCENEIKPESQKIPCTNSPCPPSWTPDPWSKCSTSCNRGQQQRSVECKQKVSDKLELKLSPAHCAKTPRPKTVQACNEDNPCIKWRIGNWTECSAECGRGQRRREVVCVNINDRPVAENMCASRRPRNNEICDMGSCAKTWFFTEWSTKCSSDCGVGAVTRDLFCSGDERQCRTIRKPTGRKSCRNDLPCGGRWFAGPWGKCSVTCGAGVLKRDVVCMKKLQGRLLAMVGDENCQHEEQKPEFEKPCKQPACQPTWYMTDWTTCSRSCNTGLRTREVKCLHTNQQVSLDCDDSKKPDIKETCSTLKCPTSAIAAGCSDKYKNCAMVIQARLCKYSYYKNICCLSCTTHSHHHHPNQHDNNRRRTRHRRRQS